MASVLLIINRQVVADDTEDGKLMHHIELKPDLILLAACSGLACVRQSTVELRKLQEITTPMTLFMLKSSFRYH